MTIWNKCIMSTVYYSNDVSEDSECVVKIDGNEILIEYEDDGIVQYKGQLNGEGHFILNGVGFNGRASLHMFPDSALLEGSWLEDGYCGMWRIKLA